MFVFNRDGEVEKFDPSLALPEVTEDDLAAMLADEITGQQYRHYHSDPLMGGVAIKLG